MTTPEQIGPYRLAGLLGRGGMGAVYRARHSELGTDAAVKLLTAHDDDPRHAARFRREAQAAARLAAHPGIAGVHDVGEQDGRWWMAMEFVDGRPLDAVIRDEPLPPGKTAAVGEALARALAHAHAAGLLHRDVKPANVLLRADGTPVLTDFGLAASTSLDAQATRLTRTGEIVGTPAYMAPEQIRGEAVDARSDVYGVGATLYECCTGTPPFAGPSLHGVLRAGLHDAPEPPGRRVAGLPRDLETIILRCLAKDPANRFASAAALADELARFRAGTPISSRRPAAPAGARRRRLAAGVLLAAAAGAAVWWFGRAESVQQRSEAQIEARRSETDLAASAGEACAAWQALIREAGPAYTRLLDAGHAVPDIDTDAALRDLQAAVDRVRAAFPRSDAPAALLAAGRLHLDEPAALNALDLAAARDPFPALLVAKIRLDGYVLWMRLPPGTATSTGVLVAPYEESPEQALLRQSAREALAMVETHPLWPYCHAAADWAQYLHGARALAEGRFAEADAAGTALLDDPLLGPGAGMIAGVARYLQHDPAGALEAWRPAIARGWLRALRNASIAHMAAGNAAREAGRAKAHQERVVELTTACLARDPSGWDMLQARATGLRGLAGHARASGQDARPLYDRALADLARALEIAPASGPLHTTRGSVWLERVTAERAAGQDPGPSLDHAVADCERALALDPELLSARVYGTRAYMERARHRFNRRIGDPRPDLDRAEALMTGALTTAPDRPEALAARGMARLARVQLRVAGAAARETLQAAFADLDAAVRLAPASALGRQQRGTVRLRLAQEAAARGALDECDDFFAQSVEDLEASAKMDPDSPNNFLWLARALAWWWDVRDQTGRDAQGLLERAERAYDGCLQLNSTAATAWLGRAQVRAQRGDRAGALADLDELLRQRPQHRGALELRKQLAGR